MGKLGTDHLGMRKRQARPKPKREVRPLFLGQWIRALSAKQVDVVRATGMNEGYLSELCSGRSKKDPGSALLADIADSLGIPVDYLYRPPPGKESIREVGWIDPAVLARLHNAQPN